MGAYTTYDDTALFRLMSTGDERAYRAIYLRYREALAKYAISITRSYEDAHDVLQDIFTYIWVNRAVINADLPLKAYLYTAVRNRSLRLLENHARRGALHQQVQQQLQQVLLPPDMLDAKESQQQLTAIIAQLPQRMRAVISLSREEQLTHREISERLSISESTVKKQVQKALRVIRRRLHPISESIVLLVLGQFM